MELGDDPVASALDALQSLRKGLAQLLEDIQPFFDDASSYTPEEQAFFAHVFSAGNACEDREQTE